METEEKLKVGDEFATRQEKALVLLSQLDSEMTEILTKLPSAFSPLLDTIRMKKVPKNETPASPELLLQIDQKLDEFKLTLTIAESLPLSNSECKCSEILNENLLSKCRLCQGYIDKLLSVEVYSRELSNAIYAIESINRQRFLEISTFVDSIISNVPMFMEAAKHLENAISEYNIVNDKSMDLVAKISDEIEVSAELKVANDSLHAALESVTQTLFEEANIKVSNEAKLRHEAQQRLKSLEAEIEETKTRLQITNLQLQELPQDISQESSASASEMPPIVPPKIRALSAGLYTEFTEFLFSASLVKSKNMTLPFLKVILEDDVIPCLKFGGNPRTNTKKLIEYIQTNAINLEEATPAQLNVIRQFHSELNSKDSIAQAVVYASLSPLTLSLFLKSVLDRIPSTSVLPPCVLPNCCCACGKSELKYLFRVAEPMPDIGVHAWCVICSGCRDRIVSVCGWYAFVRHVGLGLYSKKDVMVVWSEVMGLKRNMWLARMGIYDYFKSST